MVQLLPNYLLPGGFTVTVLLPIKNHVVVVVFKFNAHCLYSDFYSTLLTLSLLFWSGNYCTI